MYIFYNEMVAREISQMKCYSDVTNLTNDQSKYGDWKAIPYFVALSLSDNRHFVTVQCEFPRTDLLIVWTHNNLNHTVLKVTRLWVIFHFTWTKKATLTVALRHSDFTFWCYLGHSAISVTEKLLEYFFLKPIWFF